MKKLLMVILASCVSGLAFGKLPPANDEAKAKAEQAKAKSAWSDKIAAYKLCMVQDRVAAAHRKAKPGMTTAVSTACQDPGPFVAPMAAQASSPAVQAAKK